MKQTIKQWNNDEVVFECEANTLKEAVEKAVRERMSLSFTNLRGENLGGANLCYCQMNKKVFEQITKEWFEWEVEE